MKEFNIEEPASGAVRMDKQSRRDSLPAWTQDLPSGITDRLCRLNKQAFNNLCQIGVEHWNSLAQSVSNSLYNAGFSKEEMRKILQASGDAYKDEVASRDIEKAIAKALKKSKTSRSGKKGWPETDTQAVTSLIEKSEIKTVETLVDAFSCETKTPTKILQELFPGDPLLCLTRVKKSAGKTQKLSEWKKARLKGKNFIVPSPMKALMGKNLDGKISPRCKDNTGPRKYLVIDFDHAPHDNQATIISHLATIAPLVMVLNTGNRSLHAWFRCDEESENDRRRFMDYAVSLGADSSLWTECQLVRCPGGTHDKTGNPHKVLIFRPADVDLESWHLNLIPEISTTKATCSTPPPTDAKRFTPESVFYASETGGYYVDIKNAGGRFYRHYSRNRPIKAGIDRHFSAQGYDLDDRKGMIAEAMNDVEIDRAVDWAGELAGHKRGLLEYKGRGFLVTAGPKIYESKQGVFPLILSVIEQAFPNPDAKAVFLGWLSGGVEAVKAQTHHPAPMLVLAGPPKAGKSLLAYIAKSVLGGRAANPMISWTGTLPWNDDLLGSELLLIDDSVASTDPRARKEFGARFKEAIYAGDVAIHTRRKSSISLRPVWRVMVCCNETPENLSIIPPLEDGIEDKIALLKVNPVEPPMPTQTPEGREAFSKALLHEMPFFMRFLEKVEVPAELRDSRSGVKAWQDPDLLSDITAISPEKNLENLLSTAIQQRSLLGEDGEKWLSATEIDQALKNRNSPTAGQAQTLLKFHANCGTYLSKLSKQGSLFVQGTKKLHGITHYKILRPEGLRPANDIFE